MLAHRFTRLVSMFAKYWKQHVKSRHPDRLLRPAITADSLVRVSPEIIDFGLTEFDVPQTGAHQLTKIVDIQALSPGIVLESVKLSLPRTASRPFTVQRISNPIPIPHEHVFKVSVHFFPGNEIGSYEERLVFNFKSSREGEHEFSVSRTVRGFVGLNQDVARYSAKIPYTKPSPSNRARVDPNSIVPAPKDVIKPNVPYISKLPFFPTPPWINELLDSKSVDGAVQVVRDRSGSLSYANYSTFWSTLLYIEDHQAELDVQRYDLFNTKLERTPTGRYWFPRGRGPCRETSSVLRGDKLAVKKRHMGDNRWYEGVVTGVEQVRVLLKFAKGFSPGGRCTVDVQFSVSRISCRRQLLALSSPLPRPALLFPSSEDHHHDAPSDAQFEFFASAIESNHAQRQAVVSIVNNTSGDRPYVLFGPPGTGKTVTIIETCKQLIKNTNAKILLTAPSNSAADLLCSRLDVAKDMILRLNAPSRALITVAPNVMDVSYVQDDGFACPSVETLAGFRVVVSTCVSASILSGVGINRGHFSHIFVDEAGQANEAEAFLPLSLASQDTNVVLAGDPKQLGPIIRSPIAGVLGLETSMLERLMSTTTYDQDHHEFRGVTYTKLVKNYRNHPAILKTSNEKFYSGELEACAPESVSGCLREWEGWSNPEFPVMFHAVRGNDEREGTSPSFFNVAELSVVRTLVDRLQSSTNVRVLDSDIGIISPYQAQCAKLRQVLNQRDRPHLSIGSVEHFQGSERTVIIMSTVRSNREHLDHDKRFALGFLGNEKRFNVAVTRPQAGLIVVGDPDILALDPLWRRFLLYIHANGGWCGQEWDPTPFENDE
ncbi:hypothetical protein JCM11491_006113 [Sporobolomyces phaffii]